MAKNAKSKYYVVWVGAKPGVYHTWDECSAQVKGYPNARYKSFPTRSAAEKAFHNGPASGDQKPSAGKSREKAEPQRGIVRDSISVDAACSGNPGVLEYRGVRTDTGAEIFREGPFPEGTNNIGEFLAIVHALAMLAKQGDQTTPVYSDSRTARSWIKVRKARTKLQPSAKTARLFQLIGRAEQWLRTHEFRNPILIWETRQWGEIPADFGRK